MEYLESDVMWYNNMYKMKATYVILIAQVPEDEVCLLQP